MSRYILSYINGKSFITRKNLIKSNKLSIERGFSRSTEYGLIDNTIYLDGAYKGPFFDSKRKIYSLDHHENCIRQITKSTCEQALLFSKYGTFNNNEFNVIGNDPDLDTILAGWILLNIDEIQKTEIFQKLLPLILVIGNIDSYGFGYEDMIGLSREIISQEKNRINWLRKEEIKLKDSNEWSSINFTEYTYSILNKIDRYIFYKANNDSIIEPKIVKLIAINNGNFLAYVEDKRFGIYDIESQLRDDKNIECIILSNESGKYSIKLPNLMSDFSLDFVWVALSNAEMLAKLNEGITNKNDPELYLTNWGGSSNIGGSPRYSNGEGSYLASDTIISCVLNELNRQLI